MKIFRIYDSKAEHYGNLVIARTDGEAIRQFGVLANDDSTEIGRHSEDFILFHVGNDNPENGIIEPVPHRSLGKAIEYKGEK